MYVHMYDRYTNVCKVYIYMNVIMYGYIDVGIHRYTDIRIKTHIYRYKDQETQNMVERRMCMCMCMESIHMHVKVDIYMNMSIYEYV